MPGSPSDLNRNLLQQRLATLLEEYKAANEQLSYALDEVERVRIKRRIEALARDIDQVESELNQIVETGKAYENRAKPAKIKAAYNMATIRKLLKAVFEDEALRIFCFDHFRPVFEKFTPDMSRLWKIQLLLEHCEKLDEFDKLLSLVQEINPKEYDKFISSGGEATEASQTVVKPTNLRAERSPIEVVRQSTKMIVGPVAIRITGQAWKSLRQRLLTQASKLPHHVYMDTALMTEAKDDLSQLTWEVRILLEAERLEANSDHRAGIQQRAASLADYLIRIYRLEEGIAPPLEALAAGTLSDEVHPMGEE